MGKVFAGKQQREAELVLAPAGWCSRPVMEVRAERGSRSPQPPARGRTVCGSLCRARPRALLVVGEEPELSRAWKSSLGRPGGHPAAGLGGAGGGRWAPSPSAASRCPCCRSAGVQRGLLCQKVGLTCLD